jgi:hypothetical protein
MSRKNNIYLDIIAMDLVLLELDAVLWGQSSGLTRFGQRCVFFCETLAFDQ